MAFYSPAKSDFLFDGNDPVLICCQPYHRSVSLAWSLCRNSVRAPLAQGHVVPGLDNTYTIEIDMDSYSPGFYDLHVRLSLSGEQFLDGITAFAWHCEEESLVVTVPTDFDEFWNEAMASVARCPLDIQRTHFARLNRADIDAYNYTTAGLPEGYDPEGEIYDSVDIYRLSFASPSGSRIHGWLTTPSEPGCYPGMLVLPGAGNFGRPAPVEHARHGYAALDIQMHGFEPDLDHYPDLPHSQLSTPCDYSGYAIYLNALQAVNALVSQPEVDANRLCAVGGSQGGRLSIVTAALDHRIKAAVPAISHFAYLSWQRWTQRCNDEGLNGTAPFSADDVVDDLQNQIESYFDIVNFAPLVRCPVLMNMGLIDHISPPTSIHAAYRRLTGERQMVSLPTYGHDWSVAFDRYAWRWLAERLG